MSKKLKLFFSKNCRFALRPREYRMLGADQVSVSWKKILSSTHIPTVIRTVCFLFLLLPCRVQTSKGYIKEPTNSKQNFQLSLARVIYQSTQVTFHVSLQETERVNIDVQTTRNTQGNDNRPECYLLSSHLLPVQESL